MLNPYMEMCRSDTRHPIHNPVWNEGRINNLANVRRARCLDSLALSD